MQPSHRLARKTARVLLLASLTLLGLAGTTFLLGQPAVTAVQAATVTVTNTNDAGAGSLRDALATAGVGDTIDFSLTYPAIITLTSNPLVIGQDVILAGPGAASLTINGNNTFRVFDVSSGVNAHIFGVTLMNGNALGGDGGGIRNAGILTVTDSLLISNTALNGGGINNLSNLIVANAIVSGNTATNNGGGLANQAGAVLTVTDTTLELNTAANQGGGMRLYSTSNATLNNVFVSNNSATALGSGMLSRGTVTQTGPLTITGEFVQTGLFNGGNSPLSVLGNLQTGGVFTAPAALLSLSGHFTNAGTFNANGGSVSLTGCNQSLFGDIAFATLSKTTATPCTLTLGAGRTYTVTNSLTVQGASGNLLSLRSSVTGTTWFINPQGTRTVDFVDVRDSTNTNAVAIDAGASSVNSGNNVNWVFGPVSDVAVLKTVTPANGLSGTPITYTLAFSNVGAALASGVMITDLVPASIASVSVVSSGVAITDTGVMSGYVWQVQDLAPGTGGLITLTGVLSTSASGTVTNTATISATGDTISSNNQSAAGLAVCPTTIVVTSTADSGNGSLRDALGQVCFGGTVAFSLTYPTSITLLSTLGITQDVTIMGPGAANLMLDGNNSVQVMTIPFGPNVQMSGLTLANGNGVAATGGALRNAGVLTLTDAILMTSQAIRGGGLRTTAGSQTTLNNVAIISNTATVGAAGVANHGVIIQAGPITVTDEFSQPLGIFMGGNAPMIVSHLYNSGVFTSSSGALSLSGNFTNTGVFNANGGSVSLTGCNQRLLGDIAFATLAKTTATPCTLTFEGGRTYTMTNGLTLQGAAGNRLSLRSTVSGTTWFINPQLTRTVGFVDVQDSTNTNAVVIDAGASSVNSGNNVNWLFGPTSDVAVVKTVTPANGLPGATITYTLAFSNAGGAAASTVMIVDMVPASIENVTVVSSGVAITDTGVRPGYIWQVEDLAPGAGGWITLTGVLSTSASGTVINTATISAAGDTTLLNNTSAVSFNVCPATVVVTSTADSGSGSLRNALTQVCPQGVISFSVATPAMIILNGQLGINKDVTITGLGSFDLTLNGSGAGRVFDVSPNVTAYLSGLTLANGNAQGGDGGGIQNAGTLTLTDIFLTGNTGNNGGGISNLGKLTLLNSTLSGNTATNNGGGIANQANAELTLVNTSLNLNAAAVQGGGLRLFSTSSTTLDNVNISNNTANGGGAGLLSRGVLTQTGPLTVTGELSQTGTFNGGNAPLVMLGNLVNGGAFTSTSGLLSLTGHFTNTGTFTANGGSVSLTGCNQNLFGDIAFATLAKTTTSPCTLTFEAGRTYTVTNGLTLQGAAGNLLSLRSTISGTAWFINPQGTRAVSFVDVQDSHNVNATAIDAGANSVDSGNTVAWLFGPPPLTQIVYLPLLTRP